MDLWLKWSCSQEFLSDTDGLVRLPAAWCLRQLHCWFFYHTPAAPTPDVGVQSVRKRETIIYMCHLWSWGWWCHAKFAGPFAQWGGGRCCAEVRKAAQLKTPKGMKQKHSCCVDSDDIQVAGLTEKVAAGHFWLHELTSWRRKQTHSVKFDLSCRCPGIARFQQEVLYLFQTTIFSLHIGFSGCWVCMSLGTMCLLQYSRQERITGQPQKPQEPKLFVSQHACKDNTLFQRIRRAGSLGLDWGHNR